MQSSLVSVVVPVYNGGKFLAEALASILNQTYTNWECIVVDDGSLDDSFEIALSFAQRYPGKFRAFTQTNSGQAKTRNLGIENALGDFIAFLDCDDTWHRNKLEVQIKNMKSGGDFVLSLTSYSITQRKRPRRVVILKDVSALENDWTKFLGYGGGLESVGLAKADLVKLLKFDESLSTSSGLDLFLRMKSFGKVHLSPRVLMDYRKYPGQWHGDFSELKRNALSIYCKHFPLEFESYLRDFNRYERMVNVKSSLKGFDFRFLARSFQIEDLPFLIRRFYKYLNSLLFGLIVK
jgi:glycosyltransferase involved in cell wall biosynthesis